MYCAETLMKMLLTARGPFCKTWQAPRLLMPCGGWTGASCFVPVMTVAPDVMVNCELKPRMTPPGAFWKVTEPDSV